MFFIFKFKGENKNKEKIINNRVISKISIIFLLNSSFDNYLKLLTYRVDIYFEKLI